MDANEDVYSWLLLNADSIAMAGETKLFNGVPPALPHLGYPMPLPPVPLAAPAPPFQASSAANTSGVSASGGALSAPQGDRADVALGGTIPLTVGTSHAAPAALLSSLMSVPPPATSSAAATPATAAAEAKRPGRKRQGEGKDVETRKKSRLEKNRESARECRRRKKEYVKDLEVKAARLEAENTELRLQLKMGTESRQKEEAEKAEYVSKMEQMVRSGASEEELAKLLRSFGERYADYGRDRQSALQYHLEQVERMLLPTQTTKMCLWSLQQDDDFFNEEPREEDLPGGSIWTIVSRHLELTDEQKEQIKQHRAGIRKRVGELRAAVKLVRDLQQCSLHKNKSMDEDMAGLQQILTAKQAAKFLLWVDQNAACMNMLNKLWASVAQAPPAEVPGAAAGSSAEVAGPSASAPAAAAAAAVPFPGIMSRFSSAGMSAMSLSDSDSSDESVSPSASEHTSEPRRRASRA